MSIAAIKFELIKQAIEDHSLSPAAKLVYVEMLVRFRNNRTGRCDPSQELLADKLGLSVRTVERAIKDLKKAGRIAVKRRRNTSACYYFSALQEPSPVAGPDEAET